MRMVLSPASSEHTNSPSAYLAASIFDNEEDLKLMVDNFDKFAKTVFKDETEASYIKFGTMRDNDPAVNIRRGQLTLSGQVEHESASRAVC